MPIPKPHNDETEQDFVSRCIGMIHGEYTAEGQAAAVCYGAWRDRSKDKQMNRDTIIQSAKSNLNGIITADRYFKSIQTCFGGGLCPTKVFENATQEQWEKHLKDAETRLVYTNEDMIIKDLGVVGLAVTPGSIMDFDAVITSTRMDRDGDILKCDGAELDLKMPLLWQHIPVAPIGKLVSVTHRSKDLIQGRFAIAGTQLGQDTATLVEMGALRISHGFEPTDYEPIEGKNGRYMINKYSMVEVSTVSVPSNVDAVITAFSRHKLHSPLVKGWAENFYQSRPVQGSGFEPGSGGKEERLQLARVQKATDELLEWKSKIEEKTEKEHTCRCGQKDKVIGKAVVEVQVQPVLHDPNDTLRWNKSLSKNFDVANEALPASSIYYEWASKFLSAPIKKIFETQTMIPTARMGSWLTAFYQVIKDSDVIDIRNVGSYESPPVYETIQLKSDASDTFLVSGTMFLEHKGEKCMFSFSPSWYGLRITAYSKLDRKDIVNGILDESWKKAKENNLLKGEKFSLSGEFLPIGEETWDDVYLTEKNESPLKRCITNINDKQASCPNRGLIMMGPPGTGKTLSGRVIKNLANATFIWISARDFYYMGSFEGFAYAFEMAKELAPSVLFFEDVDNWIDSRTVDLLKTEMDGLTRSSGITTILTTNYPERFPEALIDRPGRFHDVLKLDLPNQEIRQKMLLKWLPELDKNQLPSVLKRTEGYSGAHIYELASFAKSIAESDELPISAALVKALDKIDEQRALINEAQLTGSNYRPRKEHFAMFTKENNEIVDLPKEVDYGFCAHKCIIEAKANENAARTLYEYLGRELEEIDKERSAKNDAWCREWFPEELNLVGV